MPRGKLRPTLDAVKALLAENRDFVRPVVQAVLQELLEAEMTEALGAEKGSGRQRGSATAVATTAVRWSPESVSWSCGCRRTARAASRPSGSSASGARKRRWWRRSPRCTSRGIASEGQGDHRGAVRPQLLRRRDQREQHAARPGAGTVRAAPARRGLPESERRRALRARARRGRDPQPGGAAGDRHRLGRPAQHSCGRTRQRESRSSWRDFLLGLRERGLSGVEFVVSDDHVGLRQAIVEVLP